VEQKLETWQPPIEFDTFEEELEFWNNPLKSGSSASKLTPGQVLEIHYLYYLYDVPQARLGSMYRVSHKAVQRIVKHYIWRDLRLWEKDYVPAKAKDHALEKGWYPYNTPGYNKQRHGN
jgi:hypothetical protein